MANFYVGPQLQEQPGFGATFGAGLGQGLSSGLQALANLQVQNLQQRRQRQGTAQALQGLGYAPEIAQQLSQFDPDTLKAVVQQQMKSQLTKQSSASGLQELIPGLQPQQYESIASLTPGLQIEFYRNYLQSLGQEVPTAESLMQNIQPGIGSPILQQTLNELAPQEQLQPPVIPQLAAAPEAEGQQNLQDILSQLGPIQGLPQVDQFSQQQVQQQAQPAAPAIPPVKRLTPAERIAQSKFRAANVKEVRAALAPIREQEKIADQQISNLDRIIELSDKDIRSGAGQQTLQRLGLGNFFLNPNSQEVQSISNRLVLDLAQKMKGSLSDKDIRFLQSATPSLANTPAGMKRLAKMMKLGAQSDKFYAEEFKKIIGKEKRLDVDTEDRAYEASKKRLDKMRDKIIQEVEKDSGFTQKKIGDETFNAKKLTGIPNPADVPGRKFIIDGQLKVSNGVEFVPVGA